MSTCYISPNACIRKYHLAGECQFFVFFFPFPFLHSCIVQELYNMLIVMFLGQISGETASSTVSAGSLSDLSNLANASLYGFEDYHGVDIGVVRAVRLWYSPLEGEVPVEIRIKDSDTKLGFAISRTEEVSSLFFLILFINNIQT